MNDDLTYAQLHTRLYEAQDARSILALLTSAGLLRGHEFDCPNRAAYDTVVDAFHLIRRLSDESTQDAAPLILDYLLPFVTGNTENEGADFARYLCRETLIDWLDSFADDINREALQNHVLDTLLHELEQGMTATGRDTALQNACWTVGTIGHRRDDLTRTLWAVVQRRDDAVGDTALATCASLGVPTNERQRLLAEAHARARRRQSRGLMQVLRHLADPSSIPIIQQSWLHNVGQRVGSSDAAPPELLEWSLVLRILAEIADAADAYQSEPVNPGQPEGHYVPDQVWQVIVALLAQAPNVLGFELALGSDLAPNCNSSDVIPSLLSHFMTSNKSASPADYHRYLAYLRSGECLRPHQLLGWARVGDSDVFARQLRIDACENSNNRGQFATEIGHRKEAAWRTALRLGLPDVLTWIEDGIEHEENPYLRGELFMLLAGLQVSPSENVLSLIQEPLELRENTSSEYAAHEGAVELAASSATYVAFDALLGCGLSIDGQWISNVAERFAECAVELARNGEGQRITTALYDRLTSAITDGDQTAAAVALERLATLHLLSGSSSDVVARIRPLLHDTGRSSYQRGLLAIVLGEVLLDQHEPLGELEPELVTWAQTDHDFLGLVTLESLALFNRLTPYPALLEQRLGLRLQDGRWHVSGEEQTSEVRWFASGPTWSTGILGKLYRHDSAAFMPAVAYYLAHPGRRQLMPLLSVLAEMYEQQRGASLPNTLGDAFLAGVRDLGAQPFPQSELLSWAARLMPDRFALEPWEELAHGWDVRLRQALADALGQARCTALASRQALVPSLLSFFGDGQYRVRRAAYRALQRQQPHVLAQVCAAWSLVEQVGYRRRAAEASAWLTDTPETPHSAATLHTKLSVDVDGHVRGDAERAWRERRDHNWAHQYLTEILFLKAWSNDEILRYWAMGDAVIQLGTEDTFAALRRFLQDTVLPVHARTWLARILKEGEKHWSEVTEKWPKPWHRLDVHVAATEGLLVQSSQHSTHCQLITWQQNGDTDAQRHGVLWSVGKRQLHVRPGIPYRFTSSDGRQSEVLVEGATSIAGTFVCSVVSS